MTPLWNKMYMQISANNIICSKQVNIFSKLKLVHVIKMVIYILHMILKPYIYIAFTVRVTEPNLCTHTHHPNWNHARVKKQCSSITMATEGVSPKLGFPVCPQYIFTSYIFTLIVQTPGWANELGLTEDGVCEDTGARGDSVILALHSNHSPKPCF